MKNTALRTLLSLIFVIGLLSAFAIPPAVAQEASAAVPAPVPGEVIALPGVTIPGWLTTGLSIFGAVSIAYQALIAAAHKRAAETADLADDKWIASLEAQAWFRILDKLFYWGGYLGAKLGGKKL